MSRLLRSTLALAATLAASLAAAQGLTNCKCDDVRELRDRWCSARAAKAEYERIAYFLESESRTTGKTRMFSNADKLMINQKCVQEAINAVSDRGVVKATALTHENLPTESLFKDDCRIEVTREGTACLKQVVESHEGHHRAACQSRNQLRRDGHVTHLSDLDVAGRLGLIFVGDSKFMMTSREFALEEAASYVKEMQLIAAKWKDLQNDCVDAAFRAEIGDKDQLGESAWNRGTERDASGKETHTYKMYDLTADPCPSRPRPTPSQCTLR